MRCFSLSNGVPLFFWFSCKLVIIKITAHPLVTCQTLIVVKKSTDEEEISKYFHDSEMPSLHNLSDNEMRAYIAYGDKPKSLLYFLI